MFTPHHPEDHTTWREAVIAEMAEHQDDWSNEIGFAGDRAVLDWERYQVNYLDCGFTLWTTTRVYFPMNYDGGWNLSVLSLPRWPCEEARMMDPEGVI